MFAVFSMALLTQIRFVLNLSNKQEYKKVNGNQNTIQEASRFELILGNVYFQV